MLFGTAHDRLNNFGSGLRGRVRPYVLRGLSAPAYTGAPWILDTTSGKLISGVYGSVGNFGSNQTVASQSSDSNFSYVTLRNTTDQSTTALTIALRPATTVQKGGAKTTTYSPVIQASTYTPPPYVAAPAPVTTVITDVVGKGTSTAIEAPTAPAPTGPGFPPLDYGYSYVLGIGETTFNAPGGDTTLFSGSADSVGQNIPYIVTAALYTGSSAIVISSTTDTLPIPPSQMNDRWEYKKEQITGPDNAQIYLHVSLRNITTQGPFYEYYYSVASGGGYNATPLVSRIITDAATWGYAEIARAGAQEAGVSQENIDLATEAGAALALAIAAGGVIAASIAAPTAAGAGAAAAFPVAVDAGSATATLILPTTAGVAAMDAAGATLLPASLSLVAPTAITATVGATVADAAVTAASTPLIPSSVTSTVTSSLTGAAKAIGTTAILTEIKKLTGQLPGVKPPSQVAPVSGAVLSPTGTGPSFDASKLVTWGLGLLAGAAILKKKIS